MVFIKLRELVSVLRLLIFFILFLSWKGIGFFSKFFYNRCNHCMDLAFVLLIIRCIPLSVCYCKLTLHFVIKAPRDFGTYSFLNVAWFSLLVFFEHFCFYIRKGYRCVILRSLISVCEGPVTLVLYNELRSVPRSCICCKNFWRTGINFSLNIR